MVRQAPYAPSRCTQCLPQFLNLADDPKERPGYGDTEFLKKQTQCLMLPFARVTGQYIAHTQTPSVPVPVIDMFL